MALRRALLALMCVGTLLATPLTGSASADSLQVARQTAGGDGSATASEVPVGFGMLAPARLMDTRSGRKTVDGQASGGGSFKSTRTLKVTGRGGVPASGVGAVIVNVTITTPSGDGYTTVFPTGSSVPTASNVNYAKGQTSANLVVAKVGVDGQIGLFNSAVAHVIVDVSGWYSEADVFSALMPARLVDTRTGHETVDGQIEGWGPLGGVVPFKMEGRGGVPSTGVGAVLLNVTITDPVGNGHVTVFPTGGTFANGGHVPSASNINYRKGQTVAGLVVARLGSDGQVSVYNSARSHVVVDVAGWYPETSDFDPLDPVRLMETRPGSTTSNGYYTVDGKAAGGGAFRDTRELKVTGRGGVPADDVGAVVVNVTVTSPEGEGYTTVFPSGGPRPTASTVNYAKGQTVANLAVVKVDSAGQISVFNSVGAHVIVDIAGWYPAGMSADELEVRHVTTGSSHTCVTTTAGTAKCWGSNGWGQLRDGSQTERTRPISVIGVEPGIVSLDAGNTFSCAVTTTGAAKCWGENVRGQLGDGTFITRDSTTPVAVLGLGSGVRSIAAGEYHTCAVMTSGAAKCWGSNVNGQLGGVTDPTRPVSVAGLESGVESITVGDSHSCALMASGEVKCWGENSYGQLGNGTFSKLEPTTVVGLESGVKDVDAGYNHTCAVTTGGAAKCWGSNDSGKLGTGTTIPSLTPVTVSGLESGVSSISAAVRHSCAVMTSGAVKCWGVNYDGRLGDRTRTARFSPVAVSGLG